MAELERERIEHFRQRWAHENFRSSLDVPPEIKRSKIDHNARGIELTGVNTPQSAVASYRSESRHKKPSAWKRSWRRRFSPSPRDSTLTAGDASQARTSIRSPVNSPNNTIYSDPRPTRSPEPGNNYGAPQPKQAPNGGTKPSEKTRAWLRDLYTLSYLALFSLLGTLSRVGTEALTQYPDAPVTSRVLWANLSGSFIMGFLVEDRNMFGLPTQLLPLSSPSPPNSHDEDHNAEDELPSIHEAHENHLSSLHLSHKKSIPLYIGLTTGYCGSFTSFSSYIRDIFLALTNALPPPSSTTPFHPPITSPSSRNGGFSLLATLAITLIHPAISLAALTTGAHLALFLRPYMPRQSFLTNFTTRILNTLSVFLGLGCWLGALLLTIFPPHTGPSAVNWRARATIALVFAPVGCILRYYLSKLNGPRWPWGTLVANIAGTYVLGMAWDLQHAMGIAAGVDGSGIACAVLLGVQEGFCGCLTTVSTWAVELRGMGRQKGWAYGFTSVGVGLAGLVIIMGSMGWTIGYTEPACG